MHWHAHTRMHTDNSLKLQEKKGFTGRTYNKLIKHGTLFELNYINTVLLDLLKH